MPHIPHPCARPAGRRSQALLVAIAVTGGLLKFAAAASALGIIWIHLCGSYTPGTGGTGGALGVAQSWSGNPGISTPYQCPETPNGAALGMETFGRGAGVPRGASAHWQINAPSGLSIIEAHTEGSGMISYGVNSGIGWGGGFYWQGGGAQAAQSETSYSSPLINSPYFGWQIVCGWNQGCNGNTNPGELSILGLELEVAETSGPTVTPTAGSLGAAGGWVRGAWPIAFTADGPTGACQLTASLGGQKISQPVSEPQSQITWHQCAAGAFNQTFNTAGVPSGAGVPLVMWARDAAYDYQAGAYLQGTASRSVNIDNDPVTVTMSGPTDAPTTTGTQYITATAAAGPSGVAGISCSTDGARAQWYQGASAHIPVSGPGDHVVRCAAANNAVDPTGNHSWSSWSSWSLSIREPTLAGIAFTSIVDKLRCNKVAKRVKVPGRWVTVRRRHKRVRVYRRPHTETVRVTRCHPRTKLERIKVWQTITRHGKKVRVKRTKTVRVVVPPHVINHTSRRIGFGKGTTISGWLGMPDGTALAGQPIAVLAAADNGEGRFRQVAVATTAANGSWTAHLRPGPARLVEAVYGGSPGNEPAVSGQVSLIVPAKILFTVSPTVTHWGGTIHITGRLLGGYIPRGKLLRLRIGTTGVSGTVGIPDIGRHGRFHTSWTFASGNGTVHYWFSVSTLPEADYAYAPASSPRRSVTVIP